MFTRSFNDFRKSRLNKRKSKFELVDNKLREEGHSLLLENQQQALSILKKLNIREDNRDYLTIRKELEKTFHSLNYLGLLTKFRFTQDTSTRELLDLIPWLKENTDRLPKNPLSYKYFENLKDDIIVADNKQRVNVVYRQLVSFQKKLISKDDKEFSERSIEVHRLGLIDKFRSQLSLHKTREEILTYMDNFIDEYSKEMNYNKTINDIKSMSANIIYNNIEQGIIIAEIFDYATSMELGSIDWCISYSRTHWNTYTSGTKRQFFIWDYTKDRTDSLFTIAFTSNSIGQITDIHDKFDGNLRGKVPDKIKDILANIELSTNPLEYKESLINKSKNSNKEIERVEYTKDDNVLIFNVNKAGYNNVVSEGWKKHYDPFKGAEVVDYNVYAIFDFNYPMNEYNFAQLVELRRDSMTIMYNDSNTEHQIGLDSESLESFEYDNKLVHNLYVNKILTQITPEEYTKKLEDMRSILIEDCLTKYEVDYESVYEDPDIDRFGEILFDFMINDMGAEVNEGDLDKVDIHRKYIIPINQDNLYGYAVYTNDALAKSFNGTWYIGTDHMADIRLTQTVEDMLDEDILYFPSHYITDNIRIDDFISYITDNDREYYYNEIIDNPSNYDINMVMMHDAKKLYNSKIEQRDQLYDEISEIEHRIEEIKSNVFENRSYIHRFNELKVMENNRDEISELEENISNLKNSLHDIEEDISDMEDIYNDDYWIPDDDEVEEEIEKLVSEEIEEIRNNPIEYLDNKGFDNTLITKILVSYLDIQGIVSDINREGLRGEHLGTNDGIEHEYTYQNEKYYIYQE